MFDNIYNIIQQNQNLYNEALKFFLSEAIDPEYFKKIQDFLENNKMIQHNNQALIKIGYFSSFDFMIFSSNIPSLRAGVPDAILGIILNLLREKLLILPNETSFLGPDQRYKANIDKVKFYHHFNLIEDLLFGFYYIIEKYKNSVLKIVITKQNSDESIGTGFYTKKYDRNILITNKHVLENANKISVKSRSNEEIKFIGKPYYSNNYDIAFLEIEFENTPFFIPELSPLILEEIITIGYPSIPLSIDSYQVIHKGEVNGFIYNYHDKNEYFIFSAKTSSGNSGSPIIGSDGMVYGMVSEELFEQKALETKGKLPYYAGINAFDIVHELKEYFPDN